MCQPNQDVFNYEFGTILVFVGSIVMTSALFLRRIRT